jgi:hypothetical protein
MVRNLEIHWNALIAAIVLSFAALLLSLRYLWSVRVLCSFVGLLLIARGWVQERAGKAYVRDCQDGGGEMGIGARLRRWLAQRFDNADDPAQERCDMLARKVRNLLQSPRLPLFTGLILYAIGAALGFVFSTYPQYPLINLTLPAWLHADALSSLMPSYLAPDFRLGTRFWAAVFLIAISVGLVSIVGFASEWRWRPRRDFFPKPSWIGFVLIALMIPVTWLGLAHHNGGAVIINRCRAD